MNKVELEKEKRNPQTLKEFGEMLLRVLKEVGEMLLGVLKEIGVMLLGVVGLKASRNKGKYDNVKDSNRIFEIEMNKINVIVKDARNAFKNDFFEYSVQLCYKSIENLAKLYYLELFGINPPFREKVVYQIICNIEAKLNKNIIDHDQLKHWNYIRNQIVHKHLKIKKRQAKEGGIFFDRLFRRLSAIAETKVFANYRKNCKIKSISVIVSCRYCGKDNMYDGSELECSNCGVVSAVYNDIPDELVLHNEKVE